MKVEEHIIFQVLDGVYKKMTSASTWIFCIAISMFLALLGAFIRG